MDKKKKSEKKNADKELELQVKEEKPAKEAESTIETLEFAQYGWCNELNPPVRYERGFYAPRTIVEYKALKKYAK